MFSASPFPNKTAPPIIKPTLIRVKSLHEKDVIDTAWSAIGDGRQLTWRTTALSKMASKVTKDCRKTAKELRDNLKLGSKTAVLPVTETADSGSGITDGFEDVIGLAGAEIISFTTELGLDLPVLRQALAVVRLAISVGKVGKSAYDIKQFYTAYKGVEQVAITNLAGTALKSMLKKELAERSVKVATCSLDLIVSLSDPTSAGSGSLKSTAKLAYRLVQLYRSYKLVKDVNAMLRDRSQFDMTIFTRMPLLGCYLFPNVETSLLLGIFYDLDDEADPELRALKTHGTIGASDLPRIEKLYKTHLKPLESLAKTRISNAPYELVVTPAGRK